MPHIVMAACLWLESTPWGTAIRASSWMFPVLLWVHYIGLSLWCVSTLAVDVRLMGVGPLQQTAVELSERLRTWKWLGFVVALLGGFLLLSAEATVYVTNVGFRLKLGVLGPLALAWHVRVQAKCAEWEATESGRAAGVWAGLVEMLLWLSVVVAAVVFQLTNFITHQ